MPCFFLYRLSLHGIRLAFALLIATALTVSTTALADWESFKSAPLASTKSKVIRGFISRPEGVGPFPAVIIAHGCFGVEQNQYEWARRLNEWGYVTLILDSFGPREVSNLCSDPDLVAADVRACDVYGAAAYLREQSFVNPQKIGMLGFSHGAWTALYAAQKDLPKVAQEPALQAVAAYYPWCPRFGLKETNTPLLVLHGKEDDWTPLDRCKRLLDGQDQPFKKNVNLIAYDHAYHGFDDSSKQPGSDYDGHRIAFERAAAEKSIVDTKIFFALYLD